MWIHVVDAPHRCEMRDSSSNINADLKWQCTLRSRKRDAAVYVLGKRRRRTRQRSDTGRKRDTGRKTRGHWQRTASAHIVKKVPLTQYSCTSESNRGALARYSGLVRSSDGEFEL